MWGHVATCPSQHIFLAINVCQTPLQHNIGLELFDIRPTPSVEIPGAVWRGFHLNNMLRYEHEANRMGYRTIAGIDEAGRGPLAGPVVAAAVVLPAGVDLTGLTDSKKLSRAAREKFFPLIQKQALGYGIAVVAEDVIDKINILQASLLAMKLAVEKLPEAPDCLLIDGIHAIECPVYQKTLIEGDSLSLSISAASVLAKVTRDRLMDDYHNAFPQYGFDRHKGYGTQLHRDRIKQFGPCPIHRKTFKGVKEYLPPLFGVR